MMSNCHKAPLITILGDEGTNHFTCKECGKPCDPLSTPPAKGEEWEGELWKLYENRTTAWVDGIVMRDFIRSTRSQAYDEGRGEGKRYIGEIKRKWYQQGAKEGRREAIEEVERLTIYTFNPVGGISNIKYIRLSDIDVLKRKEKV